MGNEDQITKKTAAKKKGGKVTSATKRKQPKNEQASTRKAKREKPKGTVATIKSQGLKREISKPEKSSPPEKSGEARFEFVECPDIRSLARRIVEKFDDVAHIELNDVFFFKELTTSPKALARCYRFGDHPIAYFTHRRYAIVVYAANVEHMDEKQMALLIYHELKHIPARGDKLIDHDVKDFRTILGFDLDWAIPGTQVPDILGDSRG